VYRNSYQITEDILDNVMRKGESGVQVTTLVTFVNKLTSSGLINKVEVEGKNVFIVTEKGRVYLDEYKKFSTITESFGLEL
jgi:predicted transcriptional regulator